MNDFEKNNFTDFTASSAMKDIGFDEGVIAYYNKSGYITYAQPTIYGIELLKNSKEDDEVGAPLHQQAVRYLRERFGLDIQLRWDTISYFPEIIHIDAIETIPVGNFYEEHSAYNAAITKAAKIVKEKQNG